VGFKRHKEDFTCEHCGGAVAGDGYTNHCPKCLWSKHVDIEPGDRAAACGGLMRPIALEGATPDYVITHSCERCGFKRRNRVQAYDDPTAVVALSGKHAA
jgi:hypothetical protein